MSQNVSKKKKLLSFFLKPSFSRQTFAHSHEIKCKLHSCTTRENTAKENTTGVVNIRTPSNTIPTHNLKTPQKKTLNKKLDMRLKYTKKEKRLAVSQNANHRTQPCTHLENFLQKHSLRKLFLCEL